MEKVVNDGKVAVLYSPGYGAGWYSWAYTDNPQMLFDPILVRAVLDGHTGEHLEKLAACHYPDEYAGGAGTLRVYWVKQGNAFEIHEYDGNEHVEDLGPCDYLVA